MRPYHFINDVSFSFTCAPKQRSLLGSGVKMIRAATTGHTVLHAKATNKTTPHNTWTWLLRAFSQSGRQNTGALEEALERDRDLLEGSEDQLQLRG